MHGSRHTPKGTIVLLVTLFQIVRIPAEFPDQCFSRGPLGKRQQRAKAVAVIDCLDQCHIDTVDMLLDSPNVVPVGVDDIGVDRGDTRIDGSIHFTNSVGVVAHPKKVQ